MCLNSYQLTLSQIDPNLCIEYVFCKMLWKHMKTNNAHCVFPIFVYVVIQFVKLPKTFASICMMCSYFGAKR